jgi:NAD(P)H-hydrate epimerase
MLKVTTAKEMQHIDHTTIEKYGLAGTVLMERAGLGVVEAINEIYFSPEDGPVRRTIVVLCGGGNNGGDGFVIARELHNEGKHVEVYLFVKPAALKGDAKINYDAARKSGVSIYAANRFISNYSSRVRRHCLIVDALLGTGLSKGVREPVAGIIKQVNEMSCPVISVDIPSGISSDTGQILGCAIMARHTVTFGLPKRGHFLYPGAEFTGRLHIKNIGFPVHLVESDKIKVNLVQKKDVPDFLPPRPKSSHKGTYGHVLIVAGSKGKTGAALMAAKACLKTGAGLVTIGVPETLVNAFQSRVTEEMILPLQDKGDGTLSSQAAGQVLDFTKERANVLAVGPGLSNDDEIEKLVCTLITESQIPVVVDADGINAIVNKVHILKKSRAPVIITPHPGEMSRLLSKSRDFRELDTGGIRSVIEQNRIETAVAFSGKTGTYLVLKGVPTVTAVPDGRVYINSTGNPGMATAGAGDVLTGMISSFLAQRLSPEIASVLGVYMHGAAGDVAACRSGERVLTASDIIKLTPQAFKSIKL